MNIEQLASAITDAIGVKPRTNTDGSMQWPLIQDRKIILNADGSMQYSTPHKTCGLLHTVSNVSPMRAAEIILTDEWCNYKVYKGFMWNRFVDIMNAHESDLAKI